MSQAAVTNAEREERVRDKHSGTEAEVRQQYTYNKTTMSTQCQHILRPSA